MIVPRCLLPLLLLAVLVPSSIDAARAQTPRERWCRPSNIIPQVLLGDLIKNGIGAINQIAGEGFGIVNPAPSLRSVFDNCIGCRLNEATGQGPGCDENHGDPHLRTRDGLRYDFQGSGDFALVVADGLEIQARYTRLAADARVSFLTGVALDIDGTTIVFGDPVNPAAAPGTVTVDGIDRTLSEVATGKGGFIELPAIGGTLQRFGLFTRLDVPGTLQLGVVGGIAPSRLQLVLDERFAGVTRGLQGNGNGDPADDLVTSAGVPIDGTDAAALYGDFASGWARTGDASLFTTPFEAAGEAAATPDSVVTLADLDPALRRDAVARCRAAGIAAGGVLDDCALDVALSGEERWIEDALALADDGRSTVSVVAFGDTGAAGGTFVLAADGQVGPGMPAAGAGTVERPFAVDRYAVTVPSGEGRWLQGIEPCVPDGALKVLVTAPGDVRLERPLGCDAAVRLPAGALTLALYDSTGDTPMYGFRLSVPAVADLGTLVLGEAIEGELAPLEAARGTLPLPSGARVFIRTGRDTSCEARWRVLDADDVTLASAAACVDLGLVTLDGPAPHVLELSGDASTRPFAFTPTGVDDDVEDAAFFSVPIVLEITTPGQQGRATFEAAAGDRLYVDTQGGVTGSFAVLQPDDTPLGASSFFTDQLLVVTQAGTHTLTLNPSGAATGTATFVVHQVAPDVAIEVVPGATIEFEFVTPGQVGSAGFTLAPGQSYRVEVLEAVQGTLILDDPDGQRIALRIGGQQIIEGIATTAGRHVVRFDPSDARTGRARIVLSVD